MKKGKLMIQVWTEFGRFPTVSMKSIHNNSVLTSKEARYIPSLGRPYLLNDGAQDVMVHDEKTHDEAALAMPHYGYLEVDGGHWHPANPIVAASEDPVAGMAAVVAAA